jgi:hypothetical protein
VAGISGIGNKMGFDIKKRQEEGVYELEMMFR